MPQNCRIVSTRQKSHSVPKDGIWCMISSLAVSMNTIRSSKLKIKFKLKKKKKTKKKQEARVHQ